MNHISPEYPALWLLSESVLSIAVRALEIHGSHLGWAFESLQLGGLVAPDLQMLLAISLKMMALLFMSSFFIHAINNRLLAVLPLVSGLLQASENLLVVASLVAPSALIFGNQVSFYRQYAGLATYAMMGMYFAYNITKSICSIGQDGRQKISKEVKKAAKTK